LAGSSQTLAVRAGGIELNVQLTGDGPVVVLLHGFPDSLHLWRAVVPHLVAAGYRVVALDQRGCGDSPTPAGRAHYGIDRLKEIVPVWKKEVGSNGESWVEGEYHPKAGE